MSIPAPESECGFLSWPRADSTGETPSHPCSGLVFMRLLMRRSQRLRGRIEVGKDKNSGAIRKSTRCAKGAMSAKAFVSAVPRKNIVVI